MENLGLNKSSQRDSSLIGGMMARGAVNKKEKDDIGLDLTTIKTRFGEITVDKNNVISFKYGILGIPYAISFCLTDMPNVNSKGFKLLQCMEDENLSFIVVPSEYKNELIQEKHIEDACLALEIEKERLLLLFIVTIHGVKEGSDYLSVNAKAPIFLNVDDKSAVQYVFQSPEYKVQHRI